LEQDLKIEYDYGIYLPEIDLWLDPHSTRAKGAGFVSHAHGDHAFWHGKTLATAATLRLMRTRQTKGAEKDVMRLSFMETVAYNNATLTLYPAGHIAGSAQILIEYQGERLLYSGDFRLRPGSACEPAVVPKADILIMETTFGKPEYLFPPSSQVLESIAAWCRRQMQSGETPVLMAYSLGKAQEALLGLKPFGFEFVVHPAIADLNAVYKDLGYAFPVCHAFGQSSAQDKVVLCPPQGRTHAFMSSLGKPKIALLSGWALDRGAKYRFQADEGFPLSDHADFSELVAYVARVEPKQVHTDHGFAAEFASHLRRQGLDARALGVAEQMELL
jgi:DNA ligase-1